MKRYSSTKVANLRRISRNERLRITFWVGLLVVVVLVIAPRLVSFTASLVLMPVVAIEDWFRESDATLAVYVRDRNDLLARQDELEQALAERSVSVDSAAVYQAENDFLRSLFVNATATERIIAGVTGRPTELPYDVLVIDKGSADGVLEDAPVYLGQDQAVGFVADVYPRSAVVTLVTTPGLQSTVYIYGPNIYTNAEGVGGGLLRVNVPQGIALTEGDQVVIPSLATGIYGAITVIESVPTRPEQYGYVTIDTPLSALRYVSVGVAPLQPISFEEAKSVISEVRSELTTVPVPEGVLVDVTSATSTASSSINNQTNP